MATQKMEKSIVIQELLSKEKCLLEKKEGKIYLNGQIITNHASELLKILSQTIIKISKNEIKLDNLLQAYLKERNYYSYKNNDIDYIQSSENEDISKQNSENEELIAKNMVSQEVLDEFTCHNQLQQKVSNQYQDILDEYVNIISQITEDTFNVSFQSPFLLSNQLNFTKMQGQISQCQYLYHYYCEFCDGYNGEQPIFKYDNSKLNKIGKYIFEKVVIQVDVDATCKHSIGKWYDEEIEKDYILNIQSEENIKFEEIEFVYSIFKLCEDYKREINIIQDQYLKKIVTSLYLLKYIHFTQNEGRFLSILYLRPSQKSKMYGDKNLNLKDKLSNVKFSELWINDVYITSQNLDYLNSLNNLTFIKENLVTENIKELHQQIHIFNRKYSNTLSIFAFDKLFGHDFSLLRVMFDLHEFDEQLPIFPKNFFQLQSQADQQQQGNQIKKKKKKVMEE